MEAESSSVKIEKLTTDNYHAWKLKIQHALVLKDLDDYINSDPPREGLSEL